jgi:ComF family protein
MTGANGYWNSFYKGALDLLYPARCGLCGEWNEVAICPTCYGEFRAITTGILRHRDGAALDFSTAIFEYQGRAAQAVRRLKYARVTPLVSLLAAEVAKGVGDLGLLGSDFFVPIPIHWSRRTRRGFNQAELLCESLPKERVAPRALLLRTRATRPQVGLTRVQRLQNLNDAFAANPSVVGKRVLLIDDVITTLHTARECAKALKAAGAAEVGILALTGEEE